MTDIPKKELEKVIDAAIDASAQLERIEITIKGLKSEIDEISTKLFFHYSYGSSSAQRATGVVRNPGDQKSHNESRPPDPRRGATHTGYAPQSNPPDPHLRDTPFPWC